MALEQTLESIAASLAVIATVMQTQAQATTVLGTAEVTTEKKTRAKKSDVTTETPAPAAPAEVAPVTAAAPTPAPATPAASTVSAQKPWPEVLAKVVEVNKSTLPTAGRKGVEAILAHFFGPDVAGKKVPNLEGLGRNDDIVAFAETLLAPEAADDDLGL